MYYKYINEQGIVYQYEKTERVINSPKVIAITEEEYDTIMEQIRVRREENANNATTD